MSDLSNEEKPFLTFKSRTELKKFALKWSLAIALILGAGTISKVPVLDTFFYMLTMFLGLSIGGYIGLRQAASKKNWLVGILEADTTQSE